MESTLFLAIIFTVLSILIIILVLWNLYEFFRLDKEQFKYFIIGLIFYTVAIVSLFLRYIVFPPLNKGESILFAYLTYISPLIGMAFFLKSTDVLAHRDLAGFQRSQKLYNAAFFMIILTINHIFIYHIFLIVSESIYNLLNKIAPIFYISAIILTFMAFLQYRGAFSDILGKVIFQYCAAVILMLIGGVITTETLRDLEIGDKVFTDLAIVNLSFSIIGLFIIFVSFLLSFLRVHKIAKTLC